MLGGWCKVRHQDTLLYIIGTSINIKTPITAQICALRDAFELLCHNNKYPTYKTPSRKVVVKRASHVHQTPHVDLPQIDPVSKVSKVNPQPISAVDLAKNAYFCALVNKYIMLKTNNTKEQKKALKAHGTWR